VSPALKCDEQEHFKGEWPTRNEQSECRAPNPCLPAGRLLCPPVLTNYRRFDFQSGDCPSFVRDSVPFYTIKPTHSEKRNTMVKILILYYSRSGNTEKMAKLIFDEIKSSNQDVELKKVEDADISDLKSADGIIVGSPTYYGGMAAQIKMLFDESVKLHGKLDGKIGAAFSTAANIAGGNETTVLDIINAMLIHGMTIQGDPSGSHYGPVSIGAPDDRVRKECKRFAERFLKLVNKIHK